MNVSYSLKSGDGTTSLTVIDPLTGQSRVMSPAHPKFEQVVQQLTSTDMTWEQFEATANVVASVSASMQSLSDRVTFDGSTVFWDGDPLDNALSRHLARLVKAGDTSYVSVVRFMERLAANPSKLSRVHLWTWLAERDFTLTRDGLILGYKGVRDVPDNLSVLAGVEPVDVNGTQHVGHIPNPVGARVSIPRSMVDPDRDQGCSVGLHVGTYEFAASFGSKLLRVLVDPADVVAVPRDHDFSKMRVTAYVVLDASDILVAEPVYAPDTTFDEWDDFGESSSDDGWDD